MPSWCGKAQASLELSISRHSQMYAQLTYQAFCVAYGARVIVSEGNVTA